MGKYPGFVHEIQQFAKQNTMFFFRHFVQDERNQQTCGIIETKAWKYICFENCTLGKQIRLKVTHSVRLSHT